jgi:hypothetical protein
VFMDTTLQIIQMPSMIIHDAPKVAFLKLCQSLMLSSETHKSVTTRLLMKLHWLVAASSPEYSALSLGSGEKGRNPDFKPSIAIRVAAASCLRCLASQVIYQPFFKF